MKFQKFQWRSIEKEIKKSTIKIDVSKIQCAQRIKKLPWIIIEEENPVYILDFLDKTHLEISTVPIHSRIFDAKKLVTKVLFAFVNQS